MGERRLPIPERPWHQSKSGCWSLSLGVRGLKVRVTQHKPGGSFQRVYRVSVGSWLLENSPLRGVKLPKEESPRRPVTTFDRFLKTRKAVQDLAATAPQERGRE